LHNSAQNKNICYKTQAVLNRRVLMRSQKYPDWVNNEYQL